MSSEGNSSGSAKESSSVSQSSGNSSSFPSVSSSSACTCDVSIVIGSWSVTSASILVYNFGTCDLHFNAYTDNPSTIIPDTDVPLGPGDLVEIFVDSFPENLDGTTLYIETDHCGIYSLYLGTTAPPDP